jgi:hypothetical protein
MVTGIATYVFVPFHNLFHMKLLLAAILAPISAIIAIDTGHRAHHEILAGQGTVTGQKMSRTGQILGYVYFGLIILLIVLAIVLFKDLASGISNLVSSLGL